MIAVVQRVSEAAVEVAAEGYRAVIGHGLCVLLCAEAGDGEANAKWMAGKLARLRIFSDDAGKMNRSVQDVGGAVLLISQFTLAGDVRQGNRPSFIAAAPPELGRQLVDRVVDLLRSEHQLEVQTGRFGAAMKVSLTNDGPVTIIVKTERA